MGITALLLVVSGVAVVAALVVRAHPSRAPRWLRERQPVQIACGAALMLVTIAVGVAVLATDFRGVPEERGVGVLIDGIETAPGRGVALSAAVKADSCRNPVEVTLIVTGTAEFWADHAPALEKDARISIAIPDDDVRLLGAGLGIDGKTSAAAPLDLQYDSGLVTSQPSVQVRQKFTLVETVVPNWGRDLRPVAFRFEADWLDGRSILGSCYLRLPALTGPATVLSTQVLRGNAVEDVSELPGDSFSVIVLKSDAAKLEAEYEPGLEVTQGVTSLAARSLSIRSELSAPAPDATIGGASSWTCSSEPLASGGLLGDTIRNKPKPFPELILGDSEQSTGAVSANRLGETVGTSNCATYTVLEAASATVRRDVASLLIGAVFSIGSGMLLAGLRRRRS